MVKGLHVITLQMTGTKRAQSMEQAIASLFRVTDCGSAEMCDKQMAFGILLDSCSLRQMTEDAITREVEDMNWKLQYSAKVKIRKSTS